MRFIFGGGWQFEIKKYFDKKYPLKFILSGSSASLIKRGSESLMGRTIEELILPFSFYEFLSCQLKDKRLDKIILNLQKNFAPSNLLKGVIGLFSDMDSSSPVPFFILLVKLAKRGLAIIFYHPVPSSATNLC